MTRRASRRLSRTVQVYARIAGVNLRGSFRGRVLGGAALALALAAAAAVVAVQPAAAKAPEASGWWNRLHQTPAPVPALPIPVPAAPATPPPPGVDEGELFVADAPDEPLAIAALRFYIAEGETEPLLRLREVESNNGDGISLQACAALSRWFPADNGPWTERPEYDCMLGSSPGVRNADGSWTFEVTNLVDADTLDVVIVPADRADGAARQPGSVTFAAPGEDALEVTQLIPAPEEFTAPPLAPEEFFAVDPVAGTPLPLGLPEDRVDELVLARPRVTPPPVAVRNVAVPVDRGNAGLAALIIFAACAAAASRLRQGRDVVLLSAPHLLRGAHHREAPAEPTVAGVGRFLRPRTGTPPPLN